AVGSADVCRGDGGRDGRAAPAAADPSERARDSVADVLRPVNDDVARVRAIVHAEIEPAQPERIAVLANVGSVGDEQPEAALVRSLVVRKGRGDVLAAAFPVSDELTLDDGVRYQIEDPETRLGGRPAVVDHGQQPGIDDDAQ